MAEVHYSGKAHTHGKGERMVYFASDENNEEKVLLDIDGPFPFISHIAANSWILGMVSTWDASWK